MTLTDAKVGQWAVGSHLIPHSSKQQCNSPVQLTSANHKYSPELQLTGVHHVCCLLMTTGLDALVLTQCEYFNLLIQVKFSVGADADICLH